MRMVRRMKKDDECSLPFLSPSLSSSPFPFPPLFPFHPHPFFSRHDQHIARHSMLVISSAYRITIFVLNVVFR